jgi:hypothetical protein
MKSALLILLVSATASASPPYPFNELLRRSETVFVGELTQHDAASITFAVKDTLRGKVSTPATFDFAPKAVGDLPDGITKYVVISQGDDRAKPTTHASLGQELKGQAGYRGWIVFPVVDGKVIGAFAFGNKKLIDIDIRDVAKVVERSPYRPAR